MPSPAVQLVTSQTDSQGAAAAEWLQSQGIVVSLIDIDALQRQEKETMIKNITHMIRDFQNEDSAELSLPVLLRGQTLLAVGFEPTYWENLLL